MNALTTIEPAALEGEVLAPGPLLFLESNPFKVGSMRYLDPPGENPTLAECVERAAAEVPETYRPNLHVWIGEHEVDRRYWASVRPKAGQTVTVRVRPHGKTGKNILRAVVIIAVVVAVAYFLSPVLGASLLAKVGVALAVAAAATLTNMALNAIIPPPGLTGETTTRDPRYQITGSANRFAPYSPIPRLFGKMRYFPVLAAHPYSEIVGKHQYLRILLNCGWGPVKISDIRIGNTPITAFVGVEYEVHEGGPDGWAGNKEISLYNRKVREQGLQIETIFNVPTVPQVTEVNTQEISVDIVFPQGLVTYTKKGAKEVRTVNHTVEWRAVGSAGAWTTANWQNDLDEGEVTSGGGTMRASSNQQEVERITGRWKVPVGQYEVRLTRKTAAGVQEEGGRNQIDTSYWSALRSFCSDVPVLQKGICLLALRIKATDQLNGVPDTISVLGEAYVPVYDAGSGTWTYQISRSPAWAFADVLRRRGQEAMIGDNRIDLGEISAWATECAAAAPNAAEARWTYDAVIEGGSVYSALRQIASIGRAVYTMKDGKHTVVRDKPQGTPVQVISPRNSWGYSASKAFLDLPHGFKVEFQNAEKDYKQDERYVYADGYSAANASKFEVLQLFGATSPTLVHREGRYHLAVAKLRPEEHRVSMDVEGLRCTIGDRVELAHDSILVGIGWGRVLSVGARGVTGPLTLDSVVPFEVGKTYSLRVRHADGTTSIRAVSTAVARPCETDAVTADTAATPLIQPGDFYLYGESGLVSAPMLVKKIEAGEDLSVNLSLVAYDPAIHTADTGAIPEFTSYMTVDQATQAPKAPGVTLRSNDSVTDVLQDGTMLNRLAVDIAPALNDPHPIEGYTVQFRELNSATWADAGTWPASTTTVYCQPVREGVAYQARVQTVGVNGLRSAWAQAANHTVIGKSIAPEPAASPTVAAGFRENYVRWTNPQDLDLLYVEVLASQTNNSATGVVVGRSLTGTFTHVNLSAGATWFYWLRAVDASNNSSALVAAGSAAALSIASFEGIGADGVLHPAEKLQVVLDVKSFFDERAGIQAQADAMVVSRAAYDGAYNALLTYLTGLSPSYSDTTQSTAIVRATWNTNWSALTTARQALLNAIDTKAATLANWSGVGGPGKPSDNAGTTLTLVPGGINADEIARVSVKGNSYHRQQAADNLASWATSVEAYPGAAVITFRVTTGLADVFAGFTDVAAPASVADMKVGFRRLYNGNYSYFILEGTANGPIQGNGTANSAWHPDDIITLVVDNVAFRAFRNGALVYYYALPATMIDRPWRAMFTGYADGAKEIQFTAGNNARWSSVGGENKPADNATVGATVGANIRGTNGNLFQAEDLLNSDLFVESYDAAGGFIGVQLKRGTNPNGFGSKVLAVAKDATKGATVGSNVFATDGTPYASHDLLNDSLSIDAYDPPGGFIGLSIKKNGVSFSQKVLDAAKGSTKGATVGSNVFAPDGVTALTADNLRNDALSMETYEPTVGFLGVQLKRGSSTTFGQKALGVAIGATKGATLGSNIFDSGGATLPTRRLDNSALRINGEPGQLFLVDDSNVNIDTLLLSDAGVKGLAYKNAAAWDSEVTGEGKPASYASADTTLQVQMNAVLAGNSWTRTTPTGATGVTNDDWRANVFIQQVFSGAMYVVARHIDNAGEVAIGLQDNSGNNSNVNDYAYQIRKTADQKAYAYSMGVQGDLLAGYVDGNTVYGIAYNGHKVMLLIDGVVKKTFTVAAGGAFRVNMQAKTQGAGFHSIVHTTGGENNWAAVGGVGKPDSHSTTGQNLIQNGDFRDGLNAWTLTGYQPGRNSVVTIDGKTYQKYAVPTGGAAHNFSLTGATVPVPSGTEELSVSWDCRIGDPGGTSNYKANTPYVAYGGGIDCFNAQGGLISRIGTNYNYHWYNGSGGPAIGEMVTYRFAGKLPVGTASIRPTMFAGGDNQVHAAYNEMPIYLGQFAAYRKQYWATDVGGNGRPEDFASSGDNLLFNQQLIYGNDGKDGWGGGFTRVAGAAGDPSAFIFRCASGGSFIATTPGLGTRYFYLPMAGQKMFVELWVKPTVGGGQHTIYGQYAKADGSFGGELVVNFFPAATGAWQRLTFQPSAPAGATAVYFSVGNYSGGTTDFALPRFALSERMATDGATSGVNLRDSLGNALADAMVRNDQQTYGQITGTKPPVDATKGATVGTDVRDSAGNAYPAEDLLNSSLVVDSYEATGGFVGVRLKRGTTVFGEKILPVAKDATKGARMGTNLFRADGITGAGEDILLNENQQWGQVKGDNKPADNAGANFAWVNGGSTVINGNSVSVTVNATDDWSAGKYAYGKDTYPRTAFVSGRLIGNTFLGLGIVGTINRPGLSFHANKMGFHRSSNGNWYLHWDYWDAADTTKLNMTAVYNGVTFGNNTWWHMTYDGVTARWYADGVLLHAQAVAPQNWFLRVALSGPTPTIAEIQAGRFSENDFSYIGGATKPEANATVGAKIGTNLLKSDNLPATAAEIQNDQMAIDYENVSGAVRVRLKRAATVNTNLDLPVAVGATKGARMGTDLYRADGVTGAGEDILLNENQQWGQVKGADRPADNAGTTLRLVGFGSVPTVQGNKVTGAGAGAWGSKSYSREFHVGTAVVAAQMNTAGSFIGLSANPTAAASGGGEDGYAQMNYSWHRSTDGNWYVHRGVDQNSFNVKGTGFTAATQFSIVYDGVNVRWYADGVLHHTVAAARGQTLYAMTSHNLSSVVSNITFAPFTDNHFDSLGGASKPEANADITSQITGATEIVVECDSAGTPLAGQFPKAEIYKLFEGANPVTAGITWTVTNPSGAAVSGATIAVSGAGNGNLSATGLASDSVDFVVVASRAGKNPRRFPVVIKKKKAAAGNTGNTEGGNTSGTAASTTSFGTLQSSGFISVTGMLTATAGSLGNVKLDTGVTGTPEGVAPAGQWYIAYRWLRETSPGVYAVIGVEFNSTGSQVTDEQGFIYPDMNAEASNSQTVSVGAGATVKVVLQAKTVLISGSDSAKKHSLAGTAGIQG